MAGHKEHTTRPLSIALLSPQRPHSQQPTTVAKVPEATKQMEPVASRRNQLPQNRTTAAVAAAAAGGSPGVGAPARVVCSKEELLSVEKTGHGAMPKLVRYVLDILKTQQRALSALGEHMKPAQESTSASAV